MFVNIALHFFGFKRLLCISRHTRQANTKTLTNNTTHSYVFPQHFFSFPALIYEVVAYIQRLLAATAQVPRQFGTFAHLKKWKARNVQEKHTQFVL